MIRQNRLLASIIGGVVVVALLVLIFAGDGALAPASEVTSSPSATTNATPEVEATNALSQDGRSDVPLLSCGLLLTDEVIDEALAVWDRPATERSTFNFAGGETCNKVLVSDDRVFVQIEPGNPNDFQPGAELLGVGGEPVAGVGSAGLWFGGAQAEGGGDQGVLSVRQTTSLGDLHFRIALGRPTLSDADQIELAKRLALVALPRFPGVGAQAPPAAPDQDLARPFEEEEEADRSDVSFVDNLLAKEEAGEWLRGGGLLATLQLFAGEAEAMEVLRQPEVLHREGTGILRMAADYLEADERDLETAAAIARLLDAREYTNEELEAMAGIGPAGATRTRGGNQPISLETVWQTAELCGNFFNGQIAQGVGVCLEWRPANVPGDLEENKYRVFIPHPSLPQAGWTEDHYELALGALEFSASWFEANGKMPAVNLVFSVAPGSSNLAEASPVAGKTCGVVLFPALLSETPSNFQQTVAHELAHCFQTENFAAQDFDYGVTMWREEGLAEYLSNLVYPQTNFEWTSFDVWHGVNRTTTVFDFSYANGLLFQYFEQEMGFEGIFTLIRNLPTGGGRAEQEVALSLGPGMKEMFCTFGEALIDGSVRDSGGGDVPIKLEYPTIVVTGPDSISLAFKPFGLGRARFEVEECRRAHFRFEWGPVRDSGRPEADDQWAPFPGTLGTKDDDDRVLIITSLEGTEVPLAITEVEDIDDDPECEDEDDAGGPVEVPTPCPLECPPSEYYWRAMGVLPEND